MSFKQYVLLAILTYVSCFIYYVDFTNEMPTLHLKGTDLLKYFGYNGEEHIIISEDGFQNKIHRIGHGENKKKVLVHVPGAHCTSEVSFALGPKRDLSYALYDAGIDVWLLNYRGTINSKPLQNKSFTEGELTNYSFHEQGYYDVSAAIDYIRDVTGTEKIILSGGSLGTTIILTLLADRPEFNRKVEKILLFGPFGPFSVLTSLFQKLTVFIVTLNKAIADYLNTSEKYRRQIIHLLCTHPMSLLACFPFFDDYMGFVSDGLSEPESAVAVNTLFSGPYLGVYEHIHQMTATKKFIKRDFGKAGNMKIYGTESPPLYNMSNVRVPVIIFDAIEDKLLTPEARKIMHDLIPNVKKVVPVMPPFQHGNFVFNGAFDENFVKNAIQEIYENI